MKKSLATLLGLLALSAPALADEAQLLAEGREIPKAMVPKLLEVLQGEIAKSGYAGAISVCQKKAPQMAKALSEKTGWSIRRVSLKNRNPGATPDEWERAVLNEFEQRLAAGEDAATLDKGAIVTVGDKQQYRYMKALPTRELCLNCHGTPDKLAPGVAQRLQQLYPQDQAIGYGLNQIRGAITARKPL